MKKLTPKAKAMFHTAVGAAVMGAPATALANDKIGGAINKGTSWITLLITAVLGIIVLVGLWMTFSGVMAMVNSNNQQMTKGQAFGKAVGGVAMVLIPGLIAAFALDLGISNDTAPAGAIFK